MKNDKLNGFNNGRDTSDGVGGVSPDRFFTFKNVEDNSIKMEEILIKAFEKAVMKCDEYYQLDTSDNGVYPISIKNNQNIYHKIHIYLFIYHEKYESNFYYDNIKYNIDYDISLNLRNLFLDKQKELKDKQMKINYDFLVNYISNEI